MEATHDEKPYTVNTRIPMEKQFECIVECDRRLGVDASDVAPMIFMNSEAWQLHISGFSLRQLAHDYVNTRNAMTTHGGPRVFEMSSKGNSKETSLFEYPPYIREYIKLNDEGISDNHLSSIIMFFAPKKDSTNTHWLSVQLICNKEGFLGDIHHIPINARLLDRTQTISLITTLEYAGHTLVDCDSDRLNLEDVRIQYCL